jgi:hypothetical protein
MKLERVKNCIKVNNKKLKVGKTQYLKSVIKGGIKNYFLNVKDSMKSKTSTTSNEDIILNCYTITVEKDDSKV